MPGGNCIGTSGCQATGGADAEPSGLWHPVQAGSEASSRPG